MNIDTLEWDEELLGAFGVDKRMMPAIKYVRGAGMGHVRAEWGLTYVGLG
jgi:glycerol kinase